MLLSGINANVEQTFLNSPIAKPGGGITKGREEVLKEVRSVHQTFLKGVSMTTENMTIRLLTPNVKIANVIHKISEFELPVGIKRENERQMKTYVIVTQESN